MISLTENTHSNIVQKVFLFSIVLGLILVMQSRILIPKTSLLSITGTFVILVVYGLIGYVVFPRSHPDIFKRRESLHLGHLLALFLQVRYYWNMRCFQKTIQAGDLSNLVAYLLYIFYPACGWHINPRASRMVPSLPS